MAKLNKSKGNMYEWVTHTLSVGKGCSHQCSYCYVKARGNIQPIDFYRDPIMPNLGSGKVIFVAHQSDLFSEGVPISNIFAVLDHLKQYPNNKYVLQTKNPSRLSDLYNHNPTLFPLN